MGSKKPMANFAVGDKVFAIARLPNVVGCPAWPARIEESMDAKKGSKYKVFFYGTHHCRMINRDELRPFNDETKAKFGNLLKGKSFPKAMYEIEHNPDIKAREQIVKVSNNNDDTSSKRHLGRRKPEPPPKRARDKSEEGKDDVFKKKVTTAVYDALSEKGVNEKSQLFRPCFKKLCDVVQMYGKDMQAAGSSTSRLLVDVARQNAELNIYLQRAIQKNMCA